MRKNVWFWSVAILFLLSQKTNVSLAAGGLAFTTEASFVATEHTVLGSPLGGLGFDPVVEKVEILARYIPNNTNPLTIFEFEGSQGNFGSFVRDFHNVFFAGHENAFPAITVDSTHGVAYFIQDQGSRIVINPRDINPRSAPSNNFIDFIVNETGPAGITYDERDDTLVILLYSDGINSGQQLIRIPNSSGAILARTPVDGRLAIDRDSELALDPTTGNYLISVGTQVFETAPDGTMTGRSFFSPNKLMVMGMEFGTDNRFLILEADGTVSLGILSVTIPVCGTDIPFQWPTGSNAAFLGQDYAQFNLLERRPDHYHTGLDISARRDVNGVKINEDVFATSRGEVEAVCPQGVKKGCIFGGRQFSTKASNHGLQGVVILKHSLPDGRVVYSLYGHLGSVETFSPGQCIDQGTKLGGTGGLRDKHLHFEIKNQPVLHNPVELAESCIDPVSGSLSSMCWGYALVHPNNLGYRNPIGFLHSINNTGFPRQVFVTEMALLRVGPGGFGGARYRPINDIETGTYEALGKAPGTVIPKCPEGWYQIRRSDSDCSIPDSCFDNDRYGLGSSIPDGWVCSRFVSD